MMQLAAVARRRLPSVLCRRPFATGTLTATPAARKDGSQKLQSIPRLLRPHHELFEASCLGGDFDRQKNGHLWQSSLKIEPSDLAGHFWVGSSHGFLLSVDQTAGDLHATNPFTGEQLPLPPSLSCPHVLGLVRRPSGYSRAYFVDDDYHPHNKINMTDAKTSFFEDRSGKRTPFAPLNGMIGDRVRVCYRMDRLYTRAILSPSLRNAVVILRNRRGLLACARIGADSSSSWSLLPSPPVDSFCDVIFRKGGLLYALTRRGTLVVFDLDQDGNCRSPPTSVSPRGPFGDAGMRFLVESPDGNDLFLVLQNYDASNNVAVFRLDGMSGGYEWKEVESIGDVAMFLGYNQSVALSSADFPHHLKPNSIYFTETAAAAGDFDSYPTGIYSLDDHIIRPFLTFILARPHLATSVWLLPPIN